MHNCTRMWQSLNNYITIISLSVSGTKPILANKNISCANKQYPNPIFSPFDCCVLTLIVVIYQLQISYCMIACGMDGELNSPRNVSPIIYGRGSLLGRHSWLSPNPKVKQRQSKKYVRHFPRKKQIPQCLPIPPPIQTAINGQFPCTNNSRLPQPS